MVPHVSDRGGGVAFVPEDAVESRESHGFGFGRRDPTRSCTAVAVCRISGVYRRTDRPHHPCPSVSVLTPHRQRETAGSQRLCQGIDASPDGRVHDEAPAEPSLSTTALHYGYVIT